MRVEYVKRENGCVISGQSKFFAWVTVNLFSLETHATQLSLILHRVIKTSINFVSLIYSHLLFSKINPSN